MDEITKQIKADAENVVRETLKRYEALGTDMDQLNGTYDNGKAHEIDITLKTLEVALEKVAPYVSDDPIFKEATEKRDRYLSRLVGLKNGHTATSR